MATVPYSTGIFETIVDVHFGGLAVEFFDGSFETIPSLPAGTAVLFAYWFRVPQTSIDKAREAWRVAKEANFADGTPFPSMCGIVPTSLFGTRTGFNRTFDSETVPGGEYDVTRWTGPSPPATGPHPPTSVQHASFTYLNYFEAVGNQLLDPSFIGIDCRTDRNLFTYNFQFGPGVHADEIAGFSLTRGSDPSEHTNTLFPINDGGVFWSYTEPTYYQDVADLVYDKEPESIRAFPSPGSGVNIPFDFEGYGYEITPNHWHQMILLVKFNPMSATGEEVTATSQVYASIDKNILTGRQLGYFSVRDNEVISPAGYLISQLGPFTPPPDVFIPDTGEGNAATLTFIGKEAPIYRFSPPKFSTGQISLPGDRRTLHMEMAEADIERWFATNDGAQNIDISALVPAFVNSDGKPATPTSRDKMLHRKPQLRLHGSGNWIAGKLTGTTKGTVRTVGKIRRYKPDPSLNGDQGEPQ